MNMFNEVSTNAIYNNPNAERNDINSIINKETAFKFGNQFLNQSPQIQNNKMNFMGSSHKNLPQLNNQQQYLYQQGYNQMQSNQNFNKQTNIPMNIPLSNNFKFLQNANSSSINLNLNNGMNEMNNNLMNNMNNNNMSSINSFSAQNNSNNMLKKKLKENKEKKKTILAKRIIPNFQVEGVSKNIEKEFSINQSNQELQKQTQQQTQLPDQQNQKIFNELSFKIEGLTEKFNSLEKRISTGEEKSKENTNKISIIENKLESGFSKLNNVLEKLNLKLG